MGHHELSLKKILQLKQIFLFAFKTWLAEFFKKAETMMPKGVILNKNLSSKDPSSTL